MIECERLDRSVGGKREKKKELLHTVENLAKRVENFLRCIESKGRTDTLLALFLTRGKSFPFFLSELF